MDIRVRPLSLSGSGRYIARSLLTRNKCRCRLRVTVTGLGFPKPLPARTFPGFPSNVATLLPVLHPMAPPRGRSSTVATLEGKFYYWIQPLKSGQPHCSGRGPGPAGLGKLKLSLRLSLGPFESSSEEGQANLASRLYYTEIIFNLNYYSRVTGMTTGQVGSFVAVFRISGSISSATAVCLYESRPHDGHTTLPHLTSSRSGRADSETARCRCLSKLRKSRRGQSSWHRWFFVRTAVLKYTTIGTIKCRDKCCFSHVPGCNLDIIFLNVCRVFFVFFASHCSPSVICI